MLHHTEAFLPIYTVEIVPVSDTFGWCIRLPEQLLTHEQYTLYMVHVKTGHPYC